jgi:PST family polysaccharide transporter
MGFAQIAKAQVLGSLFGALVAMFLAWRGFGVWSLVAQPLAGSSLALALTVRYAAWMPRVEFAWSKIRGLARFSAAVLGSDLLNYANRNADNMLIGRYLGSAQLGYYSLAYQIMLYPLSQVAGVIVRVLFPTLSQLQDDPARFRSAYLKSVAAIALVTFPMMMGLFAVAEDFVVVVFGEKWLPMLPVLKVLCWVGMIQSVGTTVGTLYLSTGRVKIMFYLTLISTPIIVGAFAVGLRWGIEGVAICYAIVSASLFYVSLTVAFRAAGLRLMDFHLHLMRPLAASLAMWAIVFVVQASLHGAQVPAAARLSALVALGALAYAGISWLINREQLMELVRVGRSAVGRGK